MQRRCTVDREGAGTSFAHQHCVNDIIKTKDMRAAGLDAEQVDVEMRSTQDLLLTSRQ